MTFHSAAPYTTLLTAPESSARVYSPQPHCTRVNERIMHAQLYNCTVTQHPVLCPNAQSPRSDPAAGRRHESRSDRYGRQPRASSNMLTAGAAVPAVKPPAPAVDKKLWHCGGQVMPWHLLKYVFFTLADELLSERPSISCELEELECSSQSQHTYFTRIPQRKPHLWQPVSLREMSGPRSQNSLQEALRQPAGTTQQRSVATFVFQYRNRILWISNIPQNS